MGCTCISSNSKGKGEKDSTEMVLEPSKPPQEMASIRKSELLHKGEVSIGQP